MSNRAENAGTTAARPPLSAILFDLRSVIGLLFVVYGIVLTIVGIIFYIWAFTKPPIPPEQDHVDHYVEGGPMHMGHDFAELHPDEVERRARRHRQGHGH